MTEDDLAYKELVARGRHIALCRLHRWGWGINLKETERRLNDLVSMSPDRWHDTFIELGTKYGEH